MKILIFTNTDKLGDAAKEMCHLDGDVYIQYVDPPVNKPEDITGVKWDALLIPNDLVMLREEFDSWLGVIGSNVKKVLVV